MRNYADSITHNYWSTGKCLKESYEKVEELEI